ncbi:MAG TPA: SDR family NAD(P)-dependent oxidoreductase [Propionibacteriaceae bacterium]
MGQRAEAKAAAKELGGDASDAIADVTNLAELEKMAKSAARRNGGIDVLCANAGIFPQARIEDMSPEQWDAVLATNLKGTFLAVKACVPYLKKSAAGRIVITSSITGPITGFPGWTHYGASKSGQPGFLRTAAIELANTGSPSTRSYPATSSPRGWSRSGRNTTRPWPPRSR